MIAGRTRALHRNRRQRRADGEGRDPKAARERTGISRRTHGKSNYVGAIESAEKFGLRLYTEAWRRGWSQANKKVVIGDGAVWIWNLADQHFPGAIQIVDLYAGWRSA